MVVLTENDEVSARVRALTCL